MAVSKDRVQFHLAMRYFQPHQTSNGMQRSTCIAILVECFGHTADYWQRMIHHKSEGFDIVCRPSQFARFIILRHEKGDCINGIRDLAPKLQQPLTLYDRIGAIADCSADTAKRVMLAAGYSSGGQMLDTPVDVSGNFNN